MDAVRSCLGPRDVAMCGIAQYKILYASQLPRASCPWCPATAAIKRATTQTAARMGRCAWCCAASPRSSSRSCWAWRSVTFVSIVAAVMSFTYSFIALFRGARPARKERPVEACVGRRPNEGAAGGDLCVRRGRPAEAGAEANADPPPPPLALPLFVVGSSPSEILGVHLYTHDPQWIRPCCEAPPYTFACMSRLGDIPVKMTSFLVFQTAHRTRVIISKKKSRFVRGLCYTEQSTSHC
ncbi:uncharacterized protein [Aegilops tauschii subsp. strangulata]|uniref:uncharacterized protein isoform X2 n=1 Tax=Aegilops tauschii subsp. strangulata TaxID=200361 RepID=UPI001ABCD1ED|nr:uncharacterized protein LOC109779404 isoform X2 [Aegilops tauschii subsp. strangulata]